MKKFFEKSGPQVPPSALVKAGKIVNAHSLTGEVKVILFADGEWSETIEEIFLKKETGEPTPYQVEWLRGQGSKIRLKLKGVDDRNGAEALKGVEIWIPGSYLVSEKGDTIYLREILGFAVEDGGHPVGVVEGFETNSSQDLLVVRLDGDGGVRALIPLVKDFLVAIDYESKIIKMNLPPGLLEANRAL